MSTPPSNPEALSEAPAQATSDPVVAPSKPKPRPFPSVTGGCVCNAIRYRLLTAPLFCYACHCHDCQKATGSAFGLFLNIEACNLSVISPTKPALVTQFKRPDMVSRHAECPKCKVELWSHNVLGAAIADVRVGTLDYPGLMEPDVHSFVESKLGWLNLPEGARTVPGQFNYKQLWPKSSLHRLAICRKKVADAVWDAAAVLDDGKDEEKEDATGGDGEKTPTAVEFGGEDDEAFEKRFRETERALQERLEKLNKKLQEEEMAKQRDLETLTANLEIQDTKSKKDDVESEDAASKPE
jgi:hypothetical protein